ncbi:MAG: hypothetical protein GY775_10015 [Candidatus Scalindua sp.]|nr:hypothetical protein [Candidatus Scalindua sp.]
MMNVHVLSIMLRKKDNLDQNLKRDKYVYREVYPVGDVKLRNENARSASK